MCCKTLCLSRQLLTACRKRVTVTYKGLRRWWGKFKESKPEVVNPSDTSRSNTFYSSHTVLLSLLLSQVKNINLNELFIDYHSRIKLFLMKGSACVKRDSLSPFHLKYFEDLISVFLISISSFTKSLDICKKFSYS